VQRAHAFAYESDQAIALSDAVLEVSRELCVRSGTGERQLAFQTLAHPHQVIEYDPEFFAHALIYASSTTA
jgi:hypothetical protein